MTPVVIALVGKVLVGFIAAFVLFGVLVGVAISKGRE
jgi:hypothetical protein